MLGFLQFKLGRALWDDVMFAAVASDHEHFVDIMEHEVVELRCSQQASHAPVADEI